jgi:hypothetical protein
MVQFDEHPSPSTKFVSSHTSGETTTPSPQIGKHESFMDERRYPVEHS